MDDKFTLIDKVKDNEYYTRNEKIVNILKYCFKYGSPPNQIYKHQIKKEEETKTDHIQTSDTNKKTKHIMNNNENIIFSKEELDEIANIDKYESQNKEKSGNDVTKQRETRDDSKISNIYDIDDYVDDDDNNDEDIIFNKEELDETANFFSNTDKYHPQNKDKSVNDITKQRESRDNTKPSDIYDIDDEYISYTEREKDDIQKSGRLEIFLCVYCGYKNSLKEMILNDMKCIKCKYVNNPTKIEWNTEERKEDDKYKEDASYDD